MPDVPWIDWYQSLAKPSWTPAPRTIGLIWQILYPVIIASFGYVFVQAARGRLPLLVALPFAINQRRSVKAFDSTHRFTAAEETKLLEAAIESLTSFNMQN